MTFALQRFPVVVPPGFDFEAAPTIASRERDGNCVKLIAIDHNFDGPRATGRNTMASISSARSACGSSPPRMAGLSMSGNTRAAGCPVRFQRQWRKPRSPDRSIRERSLLCASANRAARFKRGGSARRRTYRLSRATRATAVARICTTKSGYRTRSSRPAAESRSTRSTNLNGSGRAS